MTYISLFSDFALYLEDCLMYDHPYLGLLISVTRMALSMPGKRSTCTPPEYYRRISWPVPVDYLTCVNKRRIRTGIGGQILQYEFIFLFYFLQKIGECHMLWQWIYVNQTPVSHENPVDLSRFYFCCKNHKLRKCCTMTQSALVTQSNRSLWDIINPNKIPRYTKPV